MVDTCHCHLINRSCVCEEILQRYARISKRNRKQNKRERNSLVTSGSSCYKRNERNDFELGSKMWKEIFFDSLD